MKSNNKKQTFTSFTLTTFTWLLSFVIFASLATFGCTNVDPQLKYPDQASRGSPTATPQPTPQNLISPNPVLVSKKRGYKLRGNIGFMQHSSQRGANNSLLNSSSENPDLSHQPETSDSDHILKSQNHQLRYQSVVF